MAKKAKKEKAIVGNLKTLAESKKAKVTTGAKYAALDAEDKQAFRDTLKGKCGEKESLVIMSKGNSKLGYKAGDVMCKKKPVDVERTKCPANKKRKVRDMNADKKNIKNKTAYKCVASYVRSPKAKIDWETIEYNADGTVKGTVKRFKDKADADAHPVDTYARLTAAAARALSDEFKQGLLAKGIELEEVGIIRNQDGSIRTPAPAKHKSHAMMYRIQKLTPEQWDNRIKFQNLPITKYMRESGTITAAEKASAHKAILAGKLPSKTILAKAGGMQIVGMTMTALNKDPKFRTLEKAEKSTARQLEIRKVLAASIKQHPNTDVIKESLQDGGALKKLL